MDFVAVMLFTQQVFHLECLLLFRIKSGVACKIVVYKKNGLTLSLFLVLSGISLRQNCYKSLAKSMGFGKNIKEEGGEIAI